jgi:hypothetical protein
LGESLSGRAKKPDKDLTNHPIGFAILVTLVFFTNGFTNIRCGERA